MFKTKANTLFINGAFTYATIHGMHETMVRLYEAVKKLQGLETPTQVAHALLQSQQTIHNWEKRGMSKAGMLKAQATFGCSATWLEHGTPPMVASNGQALTKAELEDDRPLYGDNFEVGPQLKMRRYPEISWVQAGSWTEICENFVPDDNTIWHQSHVDLGPSGFVVKVRGPSMTAPPGIYPSFPEGIKLFVSPDIEPSPGKYVIVRREGNATFKKLTLVDGSLYLEALNPDWPERYIKLGDDDHYCGVVKHAGFDL